MCRFLLWTSPNLPEQIQLLRKTTWTDSINDGEAGAQRFNMQVGETVSDSITINWSHQRIHQGIMTIFSFTSFIQFKFRHNPDQIPQVNWKDTSIKEQISRSLSMYFWLISSYLNQITTEGLIIKKTQVSLTEILLLELLLHCKLKSCIII